MNRGWGSPKKPTKQQQQQINRNRNKTDQGKGAKSDPNKTRKPKPIKDPRTSGFGWGGGYGQGGFGGTAGPGTKPTDPDAPPMPDSPLPEGWYWEWDESLKQWVPIQGEAEEEEEEEDTEEADRRRTLLDTLSQFLSSYFTEDAVTDLIENVIKPGINQGMTEFEIMRSLRNSKTYKEFFPEFDQRIKNGYAAWSEGQILQYRDQARNLAKAIHGLDIDGKATSKLIASNVSISEFEHRLLVFKQVKDMGGAVKSQLERELGEKIDDKNLYEFFDPDITTSELDTAYENAIYKGYIRNLTGRDDLNVSDDQVKQLRKIGVTTQQAQQNYQKMAGILPSIERLGHIDKAVGADRDNPYDSFGAAFGAFQTMDAAAQEQIARAFARETARFSTGGGAGFFGSPSDLTRQRR